MRSLSRIPVAVAVLFLTVILAGCDATSVRRPLRHSEQYRAAVAEYKTAVVLPSETATTARGITRCRQIRRSEQPSPEGLTWTSSR